MQLESTCLGGYRQSLTLYSRRGGYATGQYYAEINGQMATCMHVYFHLTSMETCKAGNSWHMETKQTFRDI
jgi:hypothetical protein